MTDLDVARENLAVRIDDLLELLGGAGRIEVRAAVITGLAQHYRQLGIAELLCEADTDAFFGYLCASRSQPFLDAVASGDEETAARIARASRTTASPGDEEETDFLYAQFLMGIVAPDREGAPSQEELLRRLTALSDPESAPRTAVCVALHRRDGGRLEAALAALTSDLDLEWSEERRNPNRQPEQMLTEAHVSIECLALAQLGDHARRSGRGRRGGAPPPRRVAKGRHPRDALAACGPAGDVPPAVLERALRSRAGRRDHGRPRGRAGRSHLPDRLAERRRVEGAGVGRDADAPPGACQRATAGAPRGGARGAGDRLPPGRDRSSPCAPSSGATPAEEACWCGRAATTGSRRLTSYRLTRVNPPLA